MSAHLTIYRDLISKVNAVELDTPAGVTLDTCLSKLTNKYTPSSNQPFVALVNGREIPSNEWCVTLLKTGDEVTLKPRPFAQILPYIYYALVAAAAVYSYQQMQDLKNLNENYKDLPEQSGTYDVNAQGNAARLKQPIPVGFGRMRIWPDFGALPFRRYKGNKQYLYYLFCLGEVQCSLHDKKIGSTPLSSFEEVREQLYQPGEPITLFHSEVFTSPEASSVELFAPNDADYTGPSVAYTVAPDGRNVVGIELDFVCPSLYEQNKKNGNLESISLTVAAEYCAIDEENEPDNNWQPLGGAIPHHYHVGIALLELSWLR
jgi:sulfur carrier protein ThiS